MCRRRLHLLDGWRLSLLPRTPLTLNRKIKKFDVVMGCRNLDQGNFRNLTLLIKISGKIFNFISEKILNLQYRDMQAGLTEFHKILAQKILKHKHLLAFYLTHNYFFYKKDRQLVNFPPKFPSNTYTKILKSIYLNIP